MRVSTALRIKPTSAVTELHTKGAARVFPLFQRRPQPQNATGAAPVSYTHLDVYKRQLMFHLFSYTDAIADMHFMLQKEVVNRLEMCIRDRYGKRHEGSFGPSTGWRYEYQLP